MASVNPYVLQGNIGLDLQRKMDDTMASIQMLGIQEMRRREDAFVKMMDVATVNFVKDKAREKQLKDLDAYNQEAAKIAIASNYNPTPQERLKLNNLKRDFLQSQQTLLAYQQAWAKDREALAMDKGQRFDTDMGMEVINEWDGISPYSEGSALTVRPKPISDLIYDALSKSFPYAKSANIYITNKKSDGTHTKVTEHNRVGLYKLGANGKPVVDPEGVSKAYATLKDNKDIQYALSYALELELRAKTENIMQTQKVSKSKAREMAGQELMTKWDATSVEDIKDNYLKSYTEDLIAPQITNEERIKGKGSTFNLFGAGGSGGYEFGYDEGTKTVSVIKGNSKTTIPAASLGISSYKGNVPFEVTKFTPTKIEGKSYKYTEPDMTVAGVDNEKQAARKYPSGYAKASDGKFYPLAQGSEVVYTTDLTKSTLKLLGSAFVEAYNNRFGNDPDNVFNKKSGSGAPVVGDEAPIRANYKSVLEYNAALSAWKKAHPKK